MVCPRLLAATACGSGKGGGNGFAGTPEGGAGKGDATTSGGDGGSSGDSGLTFGDSSLANGPLGISPANSTISVAYGTQTPTVTFVVAQGSSTISGATFTVDRPEIGSVSASGVFTPTGLVGGSIAVTASYGNTKVTTHITVSVHYVQNGGAATATTPERAPEASAESAAKAPAVRSTPPCWAPSWARR